MSSRTSAMLLVVPTFSVICFISCVALGCLSFLARTHSLPTLRSRFASSCRFRRAGALDIVARYIGQDLSRAWSQPVLFDNLASALPNIKAARVRALAVTTLRRSPFLPDLPTVSESGLRCFDIGTWFGIFAPGGTPRDIVTRLNTEIGRILNAPSMKERFAPLGAEAMPDTPEAFGALVKSEMAKYAKIVRASGAKVD